MQGMTKRERQVTDPEQIRHILDTAKVLHLGLAVDNEPYVVPMNYGYTMEDGSLTLYVHGAVKGRKLDVLRKNPKVFFEMECDIVPFEGKYACQYGTTYASVMGLGMAQVLENPEEKIDGLTKFMKTQTGKVFTFDEKMVSMVNVIKITAKSFTAKKRPMPIGIK